MKKLLLSITLLLLLCLLLSPVCSAAEAEEGVTLSPANTVMGEWDSYILGDVDMDGKITNADALAIFRYIYDPEQYPLPVLCNHTFGEWTVADKPTCQKEGLQTRACSKCGGTEEEVLPIVDHNYLATVIAPTQTEQGYTKHTCDMCGDSYNDTFVAPTGKAEGLDYTVNADGTTCTVTGLGGCTGTVINVPAEIDGYTVTAIGDRAFAEQTALTAIYLPDTVKTIGTRAFYACSGLSEMTIPAWVTSIGTQIFYQCDNLKTVYYNSTYSSSSNLFFSQSSVEKVVFGGKKVPSYICQNSAKIETIEIKDSVTSIGSYAFQNCTNLTSITIPDSVTSIGSFAFEGCMNLNSVYITDLESWLDTNFDYVCSNPLCNGADLYLNNVLVTEIAIPNTFTSIGNYAFQNCTSLTSIVIPDSVTSIGYSAFSGCTSLASITVDADNPVYHSCGNCLIETGTKTIIAGCMNSTIPSDGSVTTIGGDVFRGCTSLSSIKIPDSVTSIGSYAFSGCTSLTSITIPDSVTSIGNYAFRDCTSLATVYYTGTPEEWGQISIGSWNYDLTSATRYYYSETAPTDTTYRYWHYVNGVPTKW